jgi:hypothetical protein
LRAFVLARLLWDPEADVDELVNDFMHGYYGRAGQQIREYFDLLHARLTPETHIHLGLAPDDPVFSDEFIARAETIFDRAEIVADDDDIKRRVELARLQIMYLTCRRNPVQARRDGTYGRFVAISEREGVTHLAEAGDPHREAFHEMMRAAE